MKTDNLVKLKTWRVEKDNNGSDYKILDNKIIAIKLKKAPPDKDKVIYNNIKILLNKDKNKEYLKIPKCKEFEITYKTEGFHPVVFNIEENMNIYNYYYILPPSKEWTTKKIKVSEMKNGKDDNSKLNLNKITGFIFSFNPNEKKEIIDTIFINKFIIKGYSVIAKKNKNKYGYTNLLLKNNFLNNIRISSLMKKGHMKLIDSEGNLLYCIEPFCFFFISINFLSVCCLIHTEENVDFANNKNLQDVWWSDEFDIIRKRIKNFNYSQCDLKVCPEFNTKRESFKNLKTLRKEYPDIADFIEGKTEKFKGFPKTISVGFDSTCNLSCRSCDSSKIKKQSKKIGLKYIKQIEDLGKDVEKLLIAAYGDPFASPLYREWLHNFPDKKFPKLKTIEIQTNAILWTKENWEKISPEIKKHNIIGRISTDGATRETYEYNRGNAKFEKLINNLAFISKLRRNNEIKLLIINFVIQKNNYREIPIMIDFAKKYSFDRILFIQIKNWGQIYTEKDFKEVNIFNKKHPEYVNFKKIYKKIKETKYDNIIVNFSFKL